MLEDDAIRLSLNTLPPIAFIKNFTPTHIPGYFLNLINAWYFNGSVSSFRSAKPIITVTVEMGCQVNARRTNRWVRVGHEFTLC